MKTCRLKTYEAVPPGGYIFENFPVIYRKFPSVPTIESQARYVSDFRKANGIPRSSPKECLQEVDAYTCQRLGCNPAYCVAQDSKTGQIVALNQSNPILTGGCAGCGARFH